MKKMKMIKWIFRWHDGTFGSYLYDTKREAKQHINYAYHAEVIRVEVKVLEDKNGNR